MVITVGDVVMSVKLKCGKNDVSIHMDSKLIERN